MDMRINGTGGYNSPYDRHSSYDNYNNDTENVNGRKSSPGECETCKNRKYQDGSDEMVSFKAAGHIDPNNAASVVMSHEQEHVSNAYQKDLKESDKSKYQGANVDIDAG